MQAPYITPSEALLAYNLASTILSVCVVLAIAIALPTRRSMRKVGGLTFVRLGSLCFSFCLTAKA